MEVISTDFFLVFFDFQIVVVAKLEVSHELKDEVLRIIFV